MFSYYLSVRLNDEPFTIQRDEMEPSPSTYLHPSNYFPSVMFAVYGMEDLELDTADSSLEELVEAGRATLLCGFEGNLLLGKDLLMQGFSPRGYLEQIEPEFMGMPWYLLPLQDHEAELELEAVQNLFILKNMDLLSPMAFEVLPQILGKLQVILLSLYHTTIQTVVFPSAPLEDILSHKSIKSNPETYEYLQRIAQGSSESEKVIYIDEWGQDDDEEDEEDTKASQDSADAEVETEHDHKTHLSVLLLALDFLRDEDPSSDFLYLPIYDQMDENFPFRG